MWLAHPDLGREDAEVEPLREAHLLEIAVQEPAGVEGVRDEAELQTSLPQRLEQCGRVRREPSRWVPGSMLGLQETSELLVVHVDPELPEEAAHQARVLDLLDGAGDPEKGFVALAEV